jgi:hypothetical protein
MLQRKTNSSDWHSFPREYDLGVLLRLRLPKFDYVPGRSTTLITPSSLSRNFLYIAGASSRLAG